MPRRPSQAMPSDSLHIDTVIAGGGIAGLWLLNVLRSRGYSAVLLEADRLGGAQTWRPRASFTAASNTRLGAP